VFAGTNMVVTIAELLADERWSGLGFTSAACLGAIVVGNRANRARYRLTYETFTSQLIYP